MDLDKYKAQNSEKAILKLREKDPITESKISGWSTIHGYMSDGNEVFASFPDDMLKACPELNGYVDLTTVAVVKTNKAGKLYLEPKVEKPAKNSGFQNPWAKPEAK